MYVITFLCDALIHTHPANIIILFAPKFHQHRIIPKIIPLDYFSSLVQLKYYNIISRLLISLQENIICECYNNKL